MIYYYAAWLGLDDKFLRLFVFLDVGAFFFFFLFSDLLGDLFSRNVGINFVVTVYFDPRSEMHILGDGVYDIEITINLLYFDVVLINSDFEGNSDWAGSYGDLTSFSYVITACVSVVISIVSASSYGAGIVSLIRLINGQSASSINCSETDPTIIGVLSDG